MVAISLENWIKISEEESSGINDAAEDYCQKEFDMKATFLNHYQISIISNL